MISLFPFFQYEEHCKEQEKEIEEKGQTISSELFFMKQFVHNACGTIALIHSVANNLNK